MTAESEIQIHCKTFYELTLDELYAILQARLEVFVVEQGGIYQDLDNDDQKSVHIWITRGDKVVATLRVCPAGTHLPQISLGRVVTTEHGKGYGEIVMRRGIEEARKRLGAKVIDIQAQEYATGFYEKVGFRVTSEHYIMDGLWHVDMQWREEWL